MSTDEPTGSDKERDLRVRLAEAIEARRVLYRRGAYSDVPLADSLASNERVLEAERLLAAATGDQYAVPLNLGFRSETGTPYPFLFQNDYSTALTFIAKAEQPDGSWGPSGIAVVRFDLCILTKFGYPNDEALAGHPLSGRGLGPYDAYEVLNSRWDRQVRDQNRVSFPNGTRPKDRHYIFTFHDSTFECLCRGMKSAELVWTHYDDVIRGIVEDQLDPESEA